MSAIGGFFPGLDFSAGTITAPLWVAGAVVGAILLLGVAALFRSSGHIVGGVAGVAGLLLAAFSVSAFLDRSIERDRLDERRALDKRMIELTSQTFATGTILGCFDTNIGEAVEASCEKAVFASPESAAAAVAFVSARLSLFADGLDFANRRDPSYEAALEGLRHSIEADRYGLVAQVFATRDGCTFSKCDSFAMLRDANKVRVNLSDRTFDGLVARHSASWPQRSRSAVATAAPAPTPASTIPLGVTGVTGINFPSAASIPPVSIMSNEAQGTSQAAAAPAAGPKRPASPVTTATVPAKPAPRSAAAPAPAPRPAQPQPQSSAPVSITPRAQ
jgi:hypothetical protein